MSESDETIIGRERVFGKAVDPQTRCRHWNSPLDIVAIKFKCCGNWFSCDECHHEIVSHQASRWDSSERGQTAAMCGKCGFQMTIDRYVDCESKCPMCSAGFNPGCRNHDHLYFDFRDD